METHVQLSDATPISPSLIEHGAEGRRLRRIARRFSESPVGFEIELPNGQTHRYGPGRVQFRAAVKSAEGLAALASLDQGRVAEAYMAGAIDLQGDLLGMCELREHLSDVHPLEYSWRFLQALIFGQVATNAKAIEVHYDLDPSFYLAFMGESRCYTQGIFKDPGEALEIAIARKFDFCLESCALEPGSHVLEIGPGWGAFAEHAARRGIRITGVTNSRKSEEYMNALGRRLGFSWRIICDDILEFTTSERYDAIVLMGIMEHLPNYPAVLRKFQELIRPGGRVYIDASAARMKYAASSFIYRYIYRGNHSFFVLHDFLAAVAKSPFMIRGIHDDQFNYFITFKRWAESWEANRERIVERFGEHHYRRFRLYLWGSAHSFLSDLLQCYRVVLERP